MFFSPIVGDWQVALLDSEGESAKVLHCRFPSAELVDGSITVYADDLAKLIALQPPWRKKSSTVAQLSLAYATSTASLDTCLSGAGIAQNKGKAEVVPTFVGEGSFVQMRSFLTSSSGKNIWPAPWQLSDVQRQQCLRGVQQNFSHVEVLWPDTVSLPVRPPIYLLQPTVSLPVRPLNLLSHQGQASQPPVLEGSQLLFRNCLVLPGVYCHHPHNLSFQSDGIFAFLF